MTAPSQGEWSERTPPPHRRTRFFSVFRTRFFFLSEAQSINQPTNQPVNLVFHWI